MRRSEPSASTLPWPPAEPRMPGRRSGTWTSLWLYLGVAVAGGLLCAESLLAVAVGPLVDAVAEEQPARVEPAVESFRPGAVVGARFDEPGGFEYAVCRANVESGVRPAPRWSAGWTR